MTSHIEKQAAAQEAIAAANANALLAGIAAKLKENR